MRCWSLALSALTILPGADVQYARADTPSANFRPDPASVRRYGPAYRYPQAGWIVLHVEGQPYERGYQHGRLMADEIVAYLRCFAAMQSPKAPADGWKQTRTLTNALFLRRFDKEYLDEMKGIADGASAAGARYEGRPLDLVDLAAINCWAEIETLPSALEALPTGLEGVRFAHPQPRALPPARPEHCSAFAATGKATADGKVVFGHITMFGLYASYHYNLYLDIKPARGHRVFMCTYPGGIQSGMDYYLNDAGILICETTIGQTRFDIKGMTLASRIRQAIQYGDSIDKAVALLGAGNNGLYTNEWLLADVNTNEIAVFQLGTHKSRLSRSSKGEWFGGTEGFYWGCNNTKDVELRLETVASVHGRPANVVFRPSDRDVAWQQLYHKHKGKIGVAFGKEAFTTPPIAAAASLDAKFTTTDLAKQLKTWALFGPPLGPTWHPTDEERQRYPDIKPLVHNPWTVLHGNPPPAAPPGVAVAVDLPGGKTSEAAATVKDRDEPPLLNVPAWHGTLLPATDGDIWLAAAFADYERLYSREKALRAKHVNDQLTHEERDALAVDLAAYRSAYLRATRADKDVPLAKVHADWGRNEWYQLTSGKGVLLLHELRRELGDKVFEEAMDSFGKAHAGQKVETADFQEHMERAAGKNLGGFFLRWWKEPGLPSVSDRNGGPAAASGGAFTVLSFLSEQQQSLIVYGTADETPSNREAAETLQKGIRRRWSNITMPVKSDKDVTDSEVKTHHVILIGRPDSNSLVERFRSALPVKFGSRSFVVRHDTYAHPGSAVVVAAENPLNPRYGLVVLAGLSAESTWHAAPALLRHGKAGAEVLVLPRTGHPRTLVLPAAELVRASAAK
jgi:hypothetical protein